MYDVMVDLETTGTNPATTGILQLSAVKFDYLTGQVGDIFDRPVALGLGRGWDYGTINWWRQDPERMKHLQHLMANGQSPREVFQALSEWLGPSDQPFRLWAKPITFEFGFIESYCTQLEIRNPFHYRYARDINTHISALMGDPAANTYSVDVPFEGTPHNAIFDALHDVRCLLKAKELYGRAPA